MRFLSENSLCVCGHVYGDHLNKAPHACTEDHASRQGHRCSCAEFQPPAGMMPDSYARPVRDKTLQAARSGADGELQRILGSLPIGGGLGELS